MIVEAIGDDDGGIEDVITVAMGVTALLDTVVAAAG